MAKFLGCPINIADVVLLVVRAENSMNLSNGGNDGDDLKILMIVGHEREAVVSN